MSEDHGPEHEHEHEPEDEYVDISDWTRSAPTRTCPACGAAGALQLGGGLFCPTCGQVTTNPGYDPKP